jgi:hypothetical protein
LQITQIQKDCNAAQATFEEKIILENAKDLKEWKPIMDVVENQLKKLYQLPYSKCIVDSAEKYYPKPTLSNPLFKNLNQECTGTTPPTYPSKILLELLEAATAKTNSYDDLLTAI